MSTENNVIENNHDFKYLCEIKSCGKEVSYGSMIYQKIIKTKIVHVCEECYNA